MPRLPFLDEVSASVSPELLTTIKSRRGGQLQEIDRLTTYSEAVARGWSEMFSSLARDCDLDIRIREIALLRVGILTRAKYEYYQHRLIALRAGMTEAEISALESWQSSAVFSSRERAVLAYTDAMTEMVQVPDAVFDALKVHFSNRQIVELTANIAGYNMVTRFMEALQMEP